jgi:hypothetical protein
MGKVVLWHLVLIDPRGQRQIITLAPRERIHLVSLNSSQLKHRIDNAPGQSQWL